MSMTYQEALSYLDAKDVFAARLGLERMRKLHEEMDLGEAKSTVHVAGTNGKGSVSAFLASIMASGGMRVGLYTSPHVLDVKERLVSGEGMITDEEFALGMDEVRSAEEKAGENVSYFEVLTALFFWWAKEKNLDHTVLETGLGGRLDATNIVIPRLSVITPISLEHTKQLGSTYAEIAAEKAAIIKHGRPTVMSPMHPDASSVVEKRCEEVLSPLIKADRYVDMRLVSALEKRGNRWGQVVEVVTTLGDYGEVFIPLLGSHQRLNAVTAIRSAEVLRRQGAKLTDRQIRHGIQETLWPARLEFIEKPMPIVLDVTHNPH
ncbi:MAG: Mur ligase family protein, partial [Candidatus Thermoplasmatota archaeon]|nr:Mur ligase family protein [Candidatus Thermoplasmatota archaeon]